MTEWVAAAPSAPANAVPLAWLASPSSAPPSIGSSPAVPTGWLATPATSLPAEFMGTPSTTVPTEFVTAWVAPPPPIAYAASGVVSAVSGATGAVAVRLPVAGAVAAVSTASGNVLARFAATGVAAAVAAGSGAVTARLVAAGTAVAVSSATGVAGTRQAASGTAAVVSTATGAVAMPQSASGTVATVSTTTGAAGLGPFLLTFTDDFNRANQSLSLTDYDYYTAAPYINAQPVIVSNQLRAGDPGGTNGNVVFGLTGPKYALNYTNRRVEFDLTSAPNATAQCGLVARATSDLHSSIQLNIVAASHGGISNQTDLTATNRTSYDQAMVASGDRIGFEVYGDTYVGYRIRSGVRLNLTAYVDTGGALVPLTAKRYGFYAMSTRSGGVNIFAATFDNYAAYDLPNRVAGDFIETGISKNGSTQTWPVSTSGWVQVTGFVAHTAYPGSTISSNGAVVRGNKTGASITAIIPFSGASLSTRQHVIRLMKNGTQIGSDSATVAATSGTCTLTVSSNVVDGDVITVEASGPNATSGMGTITASTPSITIT